MPSILNLYSFINDNSKEFVNDFLEADDVYVYRKLRATKLIAKKLDTGWKFYKSKKIPMTKIDRMLMGGYEFLIRKLETLDIDIMSKLPSNTYYHFEFTPSLKKVYLVFMESQGEKISTQEISEYASILNFEGPQIIHKGALSQDKKTELINIINSGNEITTTEFLKKVFDYSVSSSSEDIEIDNIIINFYGKKLNKQYTARIAASIINGYIDFKSESKPRDKEYFNDIYTIILLDVIAFMANSWNKYKPEEDLKDYDDRYIDYISKAFNNFYDLNHSRYTDLDLYEPEFMKSDLFHINKDFIKNEYTLQLINKSKHVEKLFRIFCAIFNKKKDTANVFNSLVNKTHIILQNRLIDEINDKISVNEKLEVQQIDLELLESFSDTENYSKGLSDDLYETERRKNYGIYTYADVKEIDEDLLFAPRDVSDKPVPKFVQKSTYLDKQYNQDSDTLDDEEDINNSVISNVQLKSNPGGIISFWDNILDDFPKANYGKKGMQSVNIVIGTFQPFHKGHINCINTMYESNKLPTLLVCVPLKKKFKRYVSFETVREILSEVKMHEDKRVCNYYFSKNRNFGDIIDELYDNNYKINECVAVDDRSMDWSLQMMHNTKNLSGIKILQESRLQNSIGEEISSGFVRKCIEDDNYKKYKEVVPEYLHSYYYKIKQQ